MPFLSQYLMDIAVSIADQLAHDHRQLFGYPIDLAALLPLSFNVTLTPIPDLSVARVNEWFIGNRSQPPNPALPPRALYGCVVNEHGHALIFIDSQLSAAEQRFTIAHEFSHYMVEHYQVRHQVQRELGSAYLDILDGKRALTAEDHLIAMRQHLPLRPYQHLLYREADGKIGDWRVSAAEQRADLLALELLAPHRLVLQHCPARELLGMQSSLFDDLVHQFGLPLPIADSYVSQLSGCFSVRTSIRQRFGD